jgi:hypothetical protein
LRNLYLELESQGVEYLVFYGATDLAEIAYVSLQETNIKLVAVIDDEKLGKRFMRYIVEKPDRLRSLSFDRVLITSLNSTDQILQNITSMGVSGVHVIQIK